MKTLRSSKDISKEDILEIVESAKECENGNYPDLSGKILGLLIFRASLRSTAGFKHSILKCGGNYIDLDTRYVSAGEETMNDTIASIEKLVDILAIRTTMDKPITNLKGNVPIINAMAGDEHTSAGLWIAYSLGKRFGFDFKDKKVGVYGQVKFSQPMISWYRIWAKLGFQFFEDSVIDELGASQELQDEIRENGGTFTKGKIEDFINDVDFLMITEGRFGTGASKETLEQYDRDYVSLNEETLSKLKQGSFWMYIAPRTLNSGRPAVPESLDNHPKMISEAVMMEESVFANMGIYKWILGE